MNLNVYYFIISAILITPFECYHHYRNKHHRRQSPQMIQNPQQIPQAPQEVLQQTPHRLYQPNSQFSISHPMYDSQSSLNRQPIENGRLSYENPHLPFGIAPDNVPVSPGSGQIPYNNVGLYPSNNLMAPNNAAVLPAIPPNNAAGLANRESVSLDNIEGVEQMDPSSFLSESSLMGESQPALSDSIQYYPESALFLPSNLNPDIVNVGSKRRKKNIEENTDELLKFFEKGKKLLELPTESSDSTGKDIVNHETSSDDNTTLINLPKGIQLKTVTKSDDSIIHAALNISSSTQTIITYDNNTELEKVVEMQLEKKIEDEKGADKGYEEVRIVETQRVKPLIKSKKSNVHVRKRKNHKNDRVFKRHRSKRSKIASDEIPRSKYLYNKMAHRFLSGVKRKERVVDPTNVSYLTNRHIIPYFQEIKEMRTTENTNERKDDLMYNKKEINDFMLFFLKEMKKFRKSLKIKNNISEPYKRMKNFVFLPREVKMSKKHLAYPEHMNVVMNLNMTWDSKMKDPIAKSVKITEEDTTTIGFENKADRFTEVMSYLETTVPAPTNETQNEINFKIVLLLSAVSCLLVFAVLLIPKLRQVIRRYRAHSAIKSYKLYDDYLKNEGKEGERMFSVDNQDLDWQSENGDWLPGKE